MRVGKSGKPVDSDYTINVKLSFSFKVARANTFFKIFAKIYVHF